MNSTTSSPFTHSQIQTLLIIKIVASFISLIGDLSVIFTITLLRKAHFNKEGKILIFIFISSISLSITNILSLEFDPYNRIYNGPLCVFQGWMLQVANNAILGWTFALCLNLFCIVTQKQKPKFWFYNLVIWIWVIISSTLPFFINGTQVYDMDIFWCWFTQDYVGYQFGLYYGPYCVQLSILIVLYILIKNNIRFHSGNENPRPERSISRWYPGIFHLFYIFPLINRAYTAINGTRSFVLLVFHCMTAPFLGVVIAIVYGCCSEAFTEETAELTTVTATADDNGDGNSGND